MKNHINKSSINQKIKYLKITLIIGLFIASLSVINDSFMFYKAEKTLFKLKSPFAVHPILTPCFLGFIGFIFFLVWLKYITQKKKHYLFGKMYILLIGAVVFGWYNVAVEFITFYSKGSYIGCSGSIVKTPFLSPCLFGSIAFLTALILTFRIKKEIKD